MNKKLTLLFSVAILLITACKKDTTTTPVTTPVNKVLDFKASSSTPITAFVITITRPTGQTTGVTGTGIAGEAVQNITAPYEFNFSTIQTGDQVYAQLYANPSQSINNSLTIDGVNIPYTSLANGPNSLIVVTWLFNVK